MYKQRFLPALLALCITSSSCLFRKSPSVFTPPPPQAPRRAASVEPLPPPPQIAADPSATAPPEVTATLPSTIEPPKPAPQPRRGPVAVAPPKPAPPAPEPVPDQPAPPKLRQIFTADQLREANRSIDESLERVRKALLVVQGKTLNSEQNEIANRIRTFQKQAEQEREQDLVTAVSLAKRADLLAQDLLQRLP
jgi:hypothetical protein